jgi:hypothetical protein
MITSASLPSSSTPRGMRAPLIAPGCRPEHVELLRRGYADAFVLAVAAARYLQAMPRDPGELRTAWHRLATRAAFGSYEHGRAKHVVDVFAGALGRFRSGWKGAVGQRPIVLECFPDGHARCADGLLGNAAIAGRLRFCPQLLARSRSEIASVVLHELLHRGLGVNDQRHRSCRSDRKHRCYRDAGLALASSRPDLAVRNIDNYVFFARVAMAARQPSAPGASAGRGEAA